MRWFVIHVKPHKERKVADMLQMMGVEVFCPMIKETSHWSDRNKVVETPLFKSFVFVKLSEKHKGIVFGAPGVVRYVFWLGRPAIVQDAQIETIKQWMVADTNDLLALSKLIPAINTVKKGVFKDQQGLVQRVSKKNESFFLKEIDLLVQANLEEVI